VTTDIDTLATALYVKVDDALKASPELGPWRPLVGIAPTLSDAEVVTLAVMSALLGYTSERRWLRRAGRDFRHLFSLPAPAVGVQQAPAGGVLPGHAHDQVAGAGHLPVERRRLGGRLHPGRLRLLP